MQTNKRSGACIVSLLSSSPYPVATSLSGTSVMAVACLCCQLGLQACRGENMHRGSAPGRTAGGLPAAGGLPDLAGSSWLLCQHRGSWAHLSHLGLPWPVCPLGPKAVSVLEADLILNNYTFLPCPGLLGGTQIQASLLLLQLWNEAQRLATCKGFPGPLAWVPAAGRPYAFQGGAW